MLIVAFMEEKTIQIFDPAFASYKSSYTAISIYLKDAYRDYEGYA
jgi:hypothetical protein